MAIIEFTFNKEKIPADAVNVQEVASANGDGTGGRYWTWETYNGLCLFDRERNGYDDSDFYMVVWNAEKGETEEIYYASTRGWTYPAYGSKVDATDEVRAAYEAYREKARRQQEIWDAERRAREVRKGRTVEVYKGRKVPQGTKGEVFWIGNGNYGERVGIKDARGEVFWTASSNVRVILEANA